MLLAAFLLIAVSCFKTTVAQVQTKPLLTQCKPVDLSSSYLCGNSTKYNQYVSAEEIWVAEVGSLRDCAALSYEHPDARYFIFDTSNNFCINNNFDFNDEDPKEWAPKKNSSRYKVYDPECWSCSDICDNVPYNTQLLHNGGFENDPIGPWVGSHVKSAPGDNSKRGFQCETPIEDPETYCRMAQSTTFCRGQLYTIEFDYYLIKGSALYGSISAYLSDTDSYYPYAPQLTVGITSKAEVATWKRAQFWHWSWDRISDPGDGKITFFPDGTRESNFRIDNVYVARFNETLTAEPGSENLVVNPGFETGDLEPWSFSTLGSLPPHPKPRVVSPGLGGSKYAVTLDYLILSQKIPTIPGTAYLFSFDYKNPSKHSSGLLYSIIGAYSQRGLKDSHEDLIPANTTATWSVPFIASDNATTISFGDDGHTNIYDNISVKLLGTPIN